MKNNFHISLFLSALIFTFVPAQAKKIHYDLTATQQSVNLSGKQPVNFAISINGTIPAPTLEFTEGDEAEIVVKNDLPNNEELSIHWHGLLLPSDMDGVPYVNTPPIKPGESFTYRFKLRQSGTYWYHSHTGVQEQKGVYGAFVIQPKTKTIKADREVAVVLSDWADEDPHQILKNLRKDGDYYLFKKDSMRSWVDAYQKGSLKNYLINEWQRMGGMDLSDVGYDAFLINGKKDLQLIDTKAGQKIRLRIINAGASTYFNVSLGALPMKIVSVDGVDVEPTENKNILMALAETYDVLFTVPANKNYELRATAQDGTGYASGWIGNANGEKIAAENMPHPDPYALMEHGDHSQHGAISDASHSQHSGEGGGASSDHSSMDHAKMDHSKMDHAKMGHGSQKSTSGAESSPTPLTVDALKAKSKTEFPAKLPRYEVELVLNGDMERYIWHINGKAIHEDRTLFIKEGDVIKYSFVNKTMMHHPMHLHGHFFRVLNKHGDFSPLKHTVDVPPHTTRTIEFLANEPGEWMLHCHNLYHMKTGMARVVKYSSFTPSAQIAPLQKLDPHLHDHAYYYGMLELATNHIQGKFRASKTWDELSVRFETRKDFSWDGEGDLFYRHWNSQFFNFIFGGTSLEKEERLVAGFGYTLPFLISTNWLIDGKGKTRLDIEKRFQLRKEIFLDIDASFRQDHKTEFELSWMYQTDWHYSGGFKFTEDSVGVGFIYQF